MIYEFLNDYFVRPLNENDLEGSYQTWFQDQTITQFNSHGKFFKNKAYFQKFYNSLNDEDKIVWAICHKNDGHIGNISLQSISNINRNAEFAILMGEKSHWGKGVAHEAGKRLLLHGFYKLNLERIYCGTSSNNIGMQSLASNLGMKEEGRRRQHLYLNGFWYDMIDYGILRSETLLKPEQF